MCGPILSWVIYERHNAAAVHDPAWLKSVSVQLCKVNCVADVEAFGTDQTSCAGAQPPLNCHGLISISSDIYEAYAGLNLDCGLP